MKTKELPPGGTLPDEEPVAMEKKDHEPYGSQVLRRLHEHAGILMKEYDEMHGPLEHEQIKEYLGNHLAALEKHMSAIEKLHKKHYKDLEPLSEAMEEVEGKDLDETAEEEEEEAEENLEEEVEEAGGVEEEKDMDTMEDEGVPAESDGSLEEPTPDEAIEGMKREPKKSLRVKYKQKTIKDLGTYHIEEQQDGRYAVVNDSSGMKYGIYVDRNQAERALADANAGKLPKYKDHRSKKKDWAEEEAAEGHSAPPGTPEFEAEEAAEPAHSKALDEHEMGHVREAGGFLKDLSEEQNFGDEHQKKSYHYHKTLEGIANLEEAHEDLNQTPTRSDVPPPEWEPGAGAKGIKSFVVKGKGQAQGRYLQEDAISWGPIESAKLFQNRKDAEDRAWEVQGSVEQHQAAGQSEGAKAQPSEGISPEKARQILKEGEARGHKLTEKQRGMFGAAAGRGKGMKRKMITSGRFQSVQDDSDEDDPNPPFLVIESDGGRVVAGPFVSESEADREAEKRNRASSGKGMPSEWESEDEHKDLHPHRKMCKDASEFLKRMAYEKAFGDAHREEALVHHKALGGIGSQQITEEVPEPGEMGQKDDEDLKDEQSLKTVFLKHNKAINDLAEKIKKVRACLN